MKLVLIAHRGGTSLKITDVGTVVTHDEGAFELSRSTGVDAEIGAELHRTTHAFGDIDERTVGEHGTVQGCEVVVAIGHYTAQILTYKLGIFANGFTDTAEDDAFFLKTLLESRFHRNGVHNRIDGHSGQLHTFFEGDAEFVEGLHQLRIDFIGTFQILSLCRVSIIGDGLIVDFRQMDMPPRRCSLRHPIAVGLQTEIQKPFGLTLFR